MNDNSWLNVLGWGLIITLCLTPTQWEFKLLIFTITCLLGVVIHPNLKGLEREIKLLQKSEEERQLHIDNNFDEIERQIKIDSGDTPLKAFFLMLFFTSFLLLFFIGQNILMN